MFHCPVGVWNIEQRAIISSATVRSPTVFITDMHTHKQIYQWNNTRMGKNVGFHIHVKS